MAKFSVPLLGFEEGLFGYDLKYTLVPIIAAVVILYGVLGGLAAAYWTDLIQGPVHHYSFSAVDSLWAVVDRRNFWRAWGNRFDGWFFVSCMRECQQIVFSLFSGPQQW